MAGNGDRVDLGRRRTLKIMALAGMLASVDLAVFDKEEFKKMLKKVGFEDVIGDDVSLASAGESKLEERARKKTEEMKKICMEAAQKICDEKGLQHADCLAAIRKCQKIHVKATPAKKGVRYAMALDLDKCIGCRRCEYACVMENNTMRNAGMEWIHVVEYDREGLQDLEGGSLDYRVAPKKGKVYVPIACMHCEHPPCVYVCPVRATWKEPDGIVVVDFDRCIGCKYCVVACPYGARRFNLEKPSINPLELNPNMHILGNLIRPVHVAEKCTWCIQRTRDGGVPACVEACPVGARTFGDLNDPEGPIRKLMKQYDLFVLKPEAGTKPRFFYYFGGARPERVGGGGEE